MSTHSTSSPRRSPRLAEKRKRWQEHEHIANVFDGIDEPTKAMSSSDTNKSSNRTAKKRVMVANDLLASSKCKYAKSKKAMVDVTKAVSPWGLPKDDKATTSTVNSKTTKVIRIDKQKLSDSSITKTFKTAAAVDPQMALSPPILHTKNRNDTVTPYDKPSRVQFATDTVFIEATKLRKNVSRTKKRVGTPAKVTAVGASTNTAGFSLASSPRDDGSSFVFGATASSGDGEEDIVVEMGGDRSKEVLSKSVVSSNIVDTTTNPRMENQIQTKPAECVGLKMIMGTPIKFSPIRSSKSLGVRPEMNLDAKQSSSRVQFAPDVVFNTHEVAPTGRKNTPHTKRGNTVKRVMSPTRSKKTLLQTGAVRLNVVYHTNPRRQNIGPRLLDSGAVRRVVTRHTTPRKLIGNRNMWSPPPSSGKLSRPTEADEELRDGMSTPPRSTPVSALKRSNASTGGHRYRAALSPNVQADVGKVSKVLFQ